MRFAHVKSLLEALRQNNVFKMQKRNHCTKPVAKIYRNATFFVAYLSGQEFRSLFITDRWLTAVWIFPASLRCLDEEGVEAELKIQNYGCCTLRSVLLIVEILLFHLCLDYKNSVQIGPHPVLLELFFACFCSNSSAYTVYWGLYELNASSILWTIRACPTLSSRISCFGDKLRTHRYIVAPCSTPDTSLRSEISQLYDFRTGWHLKFFPKSSIINQGRTISLKVWKMDFYGFLD